MPISRVRSFTDTSMMFMIPIPPTSSEIPPIAPSSSVNVPVTELRAASVSFWFVTVKSALAGSAMLWRCRRMLLTSLVVTSIVSLDVALMTICETWFRRPVRTCSAVVSGTRIWSSRMKPNVLPFTPSTPTTRKFRMRAR